MHFWLHHTAHCAEKIVSARLCAGSASAERVGQGEVGGVTRRCFATRLGFEKVGTGRATGPRPDCMDRLTKQWLLGLALKRPWLAPGGPPPPPPPPRPDCMDRLRKQWLLGLALKGPWLAPGGPPPALTAWTGLENSGC